MLSLRRRCRRTTRALSPRRARHVDPQQQPTVGVSFVAHTAGRSKVGMLVGKRTPSRRSSKAVALSSVRASSKEYFPLHDLVPTLLAPHSLFSLWPFVLLSCVFRLYSLEAELEAERARLGQLEKELENTKAGTRELESLKEGTARESEEIMGALQGQVDAANKVGGWVGGSCAVVRCNLVRCNLLACSLVALA